jgi:hypothetical protein
MIYQSIGWIICMQGIHNFNTYDLEDVGHKTTLMMKPWRLGLICTKIVR